MKILAAWLLLVLSVPALAQSVEVNDSDDDAPPVQAPPSTGKDKAKQYFQSRKSQSADHSTGGVSGQAPHYLAVHMGTFFSDQVYNWSDTGNNIHNFNGGVTYRLGEWVNSMDFNIRVEYTSFAFNADSARALSISPMLTFPDASSRFPLYFGGGVGADLFTQQVHDRSPLGLVWQVVAGARFFDVFPNVGFMVETGMKNHVLLTSVGQFNGVFLNVGVVFAF